MSSAKIFGWVLLIGGAGIIILTLFSSYNIFTGKAAAPEIFKFEKKEIQSSTLRNGKIPTNSAELQQEIQKLIADQLLGILPLDVLPKALNLFVFSMLAGILILGGAQIAGLGIRLVKS